MQRTEKTNQENEKFVDLKEKNKWLREVQTKSDQFIERIQTAIRFSVVNVETLNQLGRQPEYHVMEITYKKESKKESSNIIKTQNQRKQYTFKDYFASMFHEIRKGDGISEKFYLQSICGHPLKITYSSGKSGSLLFFSKDKQFLMKTITKSEMKFLIGILPSYIQYIKDNPDTLLNKIYGLHKIHFHSKDIRFVVLENVLYSQNVPKEVYDLKGSSVGRQATKEEAEKNHFKDKDVLHRKKKLLVGEKLKIQYMEQLTKDVNFLEHHKIMDYSLLVGIFDAEKSSDNTIFDHIKSEKRIGKFSSMRSEDGKEEYKTGVIDILQLWNFQKKAASTYKSISNEKQELSTVAPKEYAERFLIFISNLIN